MDSEFFWLKLCAQLLVKFCLVDLEHIVQGEILLAHFTCEPPYTSVQCQFQTLVLAVQHNTPSSSCASSGSVTPSLVQLSSSGQLDCHCVHFMTSVLSGLKNTNDQNALGLKNTNHQNASFPVAASFRTRIWFLMG